ncbi:MAG: 50S ribosomal protein L25 [Planctomycetes bacterium]|nr:50S ribosomal protein L25 [Planctomycetota bacterium]
MKAEVLKVKNREPKGGRSAARMRRGSEIPAVLYGGGSSVVHVAVPLIPFQELLRRHKRVLTLDVEGSQSLAFLKDVQHDAFGDTIVHIDFLRVDEKKRITVRVPLLFSGHPKGLSNGGEFVHPISEVDVECLPTFIPESIKVVVDHMDIGMTMHARELQLPENVVLKTDAEAIVATVHMKGLEPEPVVAGVEAGPAEPERIAKPAAELEGETDEKEKK